MTVVLWIFLPKIDTSASKHANFRKTNKFYRLFIMLTRSVWYLGNTSLIVYFLKGSILRPSPRKNDPLKQSF